MAKNSKLGKGFEALIPTSIDASILQEDGARVQKLLISDIKPNPDQPRKDFNKVAHDELVASIKRHGVLQPIIVVRREGGYQIVAGERRWRAAGDAKLTHIPAITRSLKELEQIELSLIENIQRVDLSPLEQAISVFKLQQQFNLGLEEISKKLGKAPSTISNLARLLQLPEDARQALADGKISEGHARAILALKESPEKQVELLRCILDNGWTVRQAEQFAVGAKSGATTQAAQKRAANENEQTRALAQKLKTDVKVRHTARGGQLIIYFKDQNQLSKMVEEFIKTSE